MLTADFLVNPNFLVVQFQDTSTSNVGTIVSWAWDFGDSSNSSLQSPSHTYTAPGTYMVSLTITDNSVPPIQSSLQRQIIISTVPVLPVTIRDFVLIKLPPPIVIPPGAIDTYIAQYQMYIQPLVNTPGVADSDTFNEAAYPPLANALIAYSAAYEITLDYANKNILLGAASGIAGTSGLLKKIETGPSNAEFQETTQLYKSIYGKDGSLSKLKEELCTLANRLLIKMPMCPPLPIPRFIPKKQGRVHTYNNRFKSDIWGLYPYIIPIII